MSHTRRPTAGAVTPRDLDTGPGPAMRLGAAERALKKAEAANDKVWSAYLAAYQELKAAKRAYAQSLK